MSQATPGVTTWEVYGGELAGVKSPPALPQNSLPNFRTQAQHTCSEHAWVALAECSNEDGKYFAKRIYCGKEWCPVCGAIRSRSHERRIARVLDKARQIDSMGYLVIEFPDKYRKIVSYAYSKKGLQIASKKIVDVLAGKRQGRKGRVGGFFKRGLLRWHWFGDKIEGKWNPHANVLVDGAFIEDIEPIKAALRQALNVPDLIVHYSYASEPGQKFQRVEYIARATFKNYDWSPYMANQLFNFRNQRWWGKWNDAPVWNIDATLQNDYLAADALEKSTCPDCGAALVWAKHPISLSLFETWEAVEIGHTGYYRLPVKQFDGDILTPADIMRLNDKRDVLASEIRLKEMLMFQEYEYKAMDMDSCWNETLDYLDGSSLGDEPDDGSSPSDEPDDIGG